MVVYYNDGGFKLGNLLYLLLQAHQDRINGIEDSYILRTGHYRLAQFMFPKTAELFSKANGQTLYPFGYFQRSGSDFSSEALDSFCRKYLLDSAKCSAKGIKETDICLAIRRTDYLKGKNEYYYGFDVLKYIDDCLNQIKGILQLPSLSSLTLRITSDDPLWCLEELFPSLLKGYGFSSDNVIIEGASAENNFYQLYSCSRFLISPNSTFVYWVGYLLRVSKPNVLVFVPNFNTVLLDDGKQIADTRGWKLIDVDRKQIERKFKNYEN